MSILFQHFHCAPRLRGFLCLRLWQPGNPQARVFLPNFWMILVKPKEKVPPNHVHFVIPMQMTEHDVREYLTKVYKLPVRHVFTEIIPGTLYKDLLRGLKKCRTADEKFAYVTMRKDFVFAFPELLPEERKKKALDQKKKSHQQLDDMAPKHDTNRPGIPSWFGF